jgi:glutamate-1-semialdehyde aminotransferase
VVHFGTFNGAPVAAAAGLALMSEIQKEGAILKADRMAGLLRDEMNAVLERHEVAGYAYGTKKISFLHRFVLQRDTLPRQARDTHRGNSKKRGKFLAGESSIFHVYFERDDGVIGAAQTRADLRTTDPVKLKGLPSSLLTEYTRHLRHNGVDIMSGTGGVVSAAHKEGYNREKTAFFFWTIL